MGQKSPEAPPSPSRAQAPWVCIPAPGLAVVLRDPYIYVDYAVIFEKLSQYVGGSREGREDGEQYHPVVLLGTTFPTRPQRPNIVPAEPEMRWSRVVMVMLSPQVAL